MEVVEEKKDDANIFKISGRLDSKTSPEFEDKVSKAVQEGADKIVFDFTDLEYISSAGLRVILKTTKDLKKKNGTLVLCSMQDYVKEVFEIAGFDTFLPIVPEVADALKKF